MAELVTRRAERLWRCPECGIERGERGLPDAARPAWCLGDDGSHRAVPTPMTFVERERVFVDQRARGLFDLFERSDWGLLDQALEHYAENRRRSVRKHHGPRSTVLDDVFARFDGMRRSVQDLRRYADPDTPGGGAVAGPALSERHDG